MDIRRLQGVALIISAVIGLVGLIGSEGPSLKYLFALGTLLFMFGVLAIEPVQQAGVLDWVGIALVELAALIALVMLLTSSGAGISGSALPLASAVLGAIGRVIVGWLTTRRNIFPAWAGWAFLAEGVLNLVGGLLRGASFGSVLGILVVLLGAAALFGYGGRLMPRLA